MRLSAYPANYYYSPRKVMLKGYANAEESQAVSPEEMSLQRLVLLHAYFNKFALEAVQPVYRTLINDIIAASRPLGRGGVHAAYRVRHFFYSYENQVIKIDLNWAKSVIQNIALLKPPLLSEFCNSMHGYLLREREHIKQF